MGVQGKVGKGGREGESEEGREKEQMEDRWNEGKGLEAGIVDMRPVTGNMFSKCLRTI